MTPTLFPKPPGAPVRLADVAEIHIGETPRADEPAFWGGDIPFFTMTDAAPWIAVETSRRITQAGMDVCRIKLHPPGTTFLNVKSGSIGTTSLSGVPMTCNESVVAVRGKDGLGPHTTRHMIEELAGPIRARTSGSLIPEVFKGTLGRLPAPVPPPEAAAEFEAWAKEMYSLGPVWERTLPETPSLAEAWLPDSPPAWAGPAEKVKLGDVADEFTESVRPPTPPLVGLEHIAPGDPHLSAWSEAPESSFSRRFLKGQVLFGARRPYQMKAVLAPFDGTACNGIIVVAAKSGALDPDLLPFVVQNAAFFRFAVAKAKPSFSPRVDWKELREYGLVLPDLGGQAKMAAVLRADLELRRAHAAVAGIARELIQAVYRMKAGTC